MFFMCPLLLGWTVFEAGAAIEGLQQMGDAVARTRQSARRFYFEYELLVFAEALLKAALPMVREKLAQLGMKLGQGVDRLIWFSGFGRKPLVGHGTYRRWLGAAYEALRERP